MFRQALCSAIAVSLLMPAPRARTGSCYRDSLARSGETKQMALLIGVGRYRSEAVPDLKAAAGDAEKMRRLLIQRYGFPPENICTLLDEQASMAGFLLAFDKALLEHARQGDVAVIYFAGHGSQAPDGNQDEADGLDETLLLFDSRTGGVPDLSDDVFNRLLDRLYQKTRNITVILDSCNSGTADRGDDSLYLVRSVPAAGGQVNNPVPTKVADEGRVDLLTRSMPDLVRLSASQDGESAREIPGYGGIFTSALLLVLSEAGSRPLTYAQLQRQVQSLVRAESPQIPYFQGNLERLVFGAAALNRPQRWEVIRTGPPLELGGPPLAGLGDGAELRIYDGASERKTLRDPSRAKATAVIDSFNGLNATARFVSPSLKEAIRAGDLAVLVRPAHQFLRLRVRIRPGDEPAGVPDSLANELAKAVEQVAEASLLVELTDRRGGFELGMGEAGNLQLQDPDGRVRRSFSGSVISQAYAAANNLWQHARQKALLQLRGEGGEDFMDGQTLQVQLVPAARQAAAEPKEWNQAKPNSQQEVPLGHFWNVKVRLSDDSPKPLLIGVLILSSDGAIAALPSGRRQVRLDPGRSYTFNLPDETFQGQPPLNIPDQILVFGTQESNPVAWHLLAESALTRGGQSSGAASGSSLYRALDRYLSLGTRGSKAQDGGQEDSTWTMSSMLLRVVAAK